MANHIELAFWLLIAVIAITAATRPSPRRRRPSPVQRGGQEQGRDGGEPSQDTRHQAGPRSPDRVHRNRWDRLDMVRGIGRDWALPDLRLILWPQPRSA
ncbi:MAG TPA: hypothetical protein VIL01_07770 [Thermomicrobiales bacterium]